MIQQDLEGNTVEGGVRDERTLLYITGYTKNLFRQTRLVTDLPMMELAQIGIKAMVAVLEKTNISEADISAILESRDKDEIISILKNAFQSI